MIVWPYNQLGQDARCACWTSGFASRPCPRRYMPILGLLAAVLSFLIVPSPIQANESYPLPVEEVTISGKGRNLYVDIEYSILAKLQHHEAGSAIASLRLHIDDLVFDVPEEQLSGIVDPIFSTSGLVSDCCIMGDFFYYRFNYGPEQDCDSQGLPSSMKVAVIEILASEDEVNLTTFDPCTQKL